MATGQRDIPQYGSGPRGLVSQGDTGGLSNYALGGGVPGGSRVESVPLRLRPHRSDPGVDSHRWSFAARAPLSSTSRSISS